MVEQPVDTLTTDNTVYLATLNGSFPNTIGYMSQSEAKKFLTKYMLGWFMAHSEATSPVIRETRIVMKDSTVTSKVFEISFLTFDVLLSASNYGATLSANSEYGYIFDLPGGAMNHIYGGVVTPITNSSYPSRVISATLQYPSSYDKIGINIMAPATYTGHIGFGAILLGEMNG